MIWFWMLAIIINAPQKSSMSYYTFSENFAVRKLLRQRSLLPFTFSWRLNSRELQRLFLIVYCEYYFFYILIVIAISHSFPMLCKGHICNLINQCSRMIPQFLSMFLFHRLWLWFNTCLICYCMAFWIDANICIMFYCSYLPSISSRTFRIISLLIVLLKCGLFLVNI